MLRVFHVPSHLTYAATLSDTAFAPVPSPTGRLLRVADLLALKAWDFFDVLHLHTVELATYGELDQLVARTKHERTGLVFTAHDLAPNIETDRAAFDSKTTLLARSAQAVVTLTATAAEVLADRVGITASAVHKLPHGAALPLPLVGNTADGSGVAAFGAMRPNRDFGALVTAWRRLSSRPPLRVLMRSVREQDRQRYASLLAELDQAAQADPELTVRTTSEVVPPEELAMWCHQARVLVLPYTTITHSGQMELARDLGLRLLAPDVPTLRDQLAAGPECPSIWFPAEALNSPDRFANYLQQAVSLPGPTQSSNAVRAYRDREHRHLLDAHRDLYTAAAE